MNLVKFQVISIAMVITTLCVVDLCLFVFDLPTQSATLFGLIGIACTLFYIVWAVPLLIENYIAKLKLPYGEEEEE